MPSRDSRNIYMSVANRIIEHHGHDRYRQYLSHHDVPDDGGRPHFPQYAVVQCGDCSTMLHHANMSFVETYASRYRLRRYEPDNITQVHVLQADRESLMVSLCPSCVDSCEWCGEENVRLNNRSYHSIVLCENCEGYASSCENCGTVMNTDTDNTYSFDYYGRRDDTFCRSCYRDVATSCGDCGMEYHQDDDVPCECEEERRHSGLILDYNAMRDGSDRIFNVGVNDDGSIVRVLTQSRFNRSEFVHEPVMGFEAECEAENSDREEGAQMFSNMINDQRLYLKDDSSLNYGMEIVTQPHTLDMYQNHFDWEPFRQLSKHGFRAYKYHDANLGHDVGFHIHINRNAFYTKRLHERTSSSPHLYGFLSFIYHNVPAMTRISSRNSHYGTITENELDNIYGYARNRSYGDRSVAVNCRNQHTIELRCFNGALNPDRILGYLEFTHALWAYTSNGRIAKMKEHHKMDFNAFADWVQHDPKYSNLVSLVKRSDARGSY